MKHTVAILLILICSLPFEASNCTSPSTTTNTTSTSTSTPSTTTAGTSSTTGTGSTAGTGTSTGTGTNVGSTTGSTTNDFIVPSFISPYHKTTMVSLTPTLRWISAGTGATYTVYCDQATNPITAVAINISATTYPITTPLLPVTSYYWKIIAKSATGETKESAVFKFETLQSGLPIFITKYTVYNGDLIFETDMTGLSAENIALQQNKARHQDLWSHVKNLIPMSLVSYIKEFQVFNMGGFPAGVAGKLSTSHTNKEMMLGLDVKGAYDASGNYTYGFSHTIIHELGHIASYTETEIDETVSQAACTTYYCSQGATRPTSIMWTIYNKYWLTIPRADLLDLTHDQRQAKYNPPTDITMPFVTGYAMKSIEEDVAETFDAFVSINPKPPASGDTFLKYYNKVFEFYAIPKFVAYRDAIRASAEFSKLP